MCENHEKTKFDPDLSPENEQNRQAAEERGWIFNKHLGVYLDDSGCLMADRYGQPL